MKRLDGKDRLARSQRLLERADAALRRSSLILANAHSLLDQPMDAKPSDAADETSSALGNTPDVW